MSYLWWGHPHNARLYHIFEGDGLADSLCGSWALADDGNEPHVNDDDDWRDGKDCKACCREAVLIND